MRVLWSERARRDVARIRECPVRVAAPVSECGEGYREMVVSRYHYIVRYELMPDPEHSNRTAVGVLSVWYPAQDRE
jgi:plasmid stabilization system protein ParE